jgi:hypothetical protein
VIFREQPVTVSQVIGTANREVPLPTTEGNPPLPQESIGQLHDVLGEIDSRLSSHKIGIYVSQQKGRIVEGLELVNAGKQGGSSRWMVRRAGDLGSAAGGSWPPTVSGAAAVVGQTSGAVVGGSGK